jgi:hypothetical protein
MSFVHFLVVPKRRIYNAVTLVKEDVPMLRVGGAGSRGGRW